MLRGGGFGGFLGSGVGDDDSMGLGLGVMVMIKVRLCFLVVWVMVFIGFGGWIGTKRYEYGLPGPDPKSFDLLSASLSFFSKMAIMGWLC
ncbi:hypothetical protein Q3G72_002672 [Acer saccharum]|nr:hypothetical protein Q3G72_002672 [Acer saccharum]